MTALASIATTSSVSIRLLSYFFLRWALIPILPPVIFTLLAINLPSFLLSHLTESRYEVVEDKVDVVVTDTIVTNGNGKPEEDANEVAVEDEEIGVTETVTLAEKPLRPLRTALLGAPSPSKLLSMLTVLVNVALVFMTADRLYTEHKISAEDLSFVRVGYVSAQEAKFVVREPDQSKMPVTMEIRIRDPEPPFENPMWTSAGGLRWTDNSTDFTAVLQVPLRSPVQRVYEWRTSNGHAGAFAAAPKTGQMPTLFGGKFTFVATSCMVSRLPYSPLDDPLAIPGARHLARLLPSLGAQLVLFLGDFVYVDVPRWWGTTVADYRRKYRQVYASPDWAPMAQNVSWIHVLDDHEISNDWSAGVTGVYQAAVEPYRHYHMAANPPPVRTVAAKDTQVVGEGSARLALAASSSSLSLSTAAAAGTSATYFEFAQGPASFFLMDTRTYRSSNRLPSHAVNKTMLGAVQRADLLAYLRRREPRGVHWKIVVSSVPFTKNWRVNTRDTWGGFLEERQVLLEAMWDAGRRGTGVVVLSGDRHEFAATRFPPPAANASRWPANVAVHEFSASPLSQFYSPVPSYFQWDDEDVKIRGNSKFGVVTLHAANGSHGGGQSALEYRLFVDGKEAWNTTLVSPTTVDDAKPASLWERLWGVKGG